MVFNNTSPPARSYHQHTEPDQDGPRPDDRSNTNHTPSPSRRLQHPLREGYQGEDDGQAQEGMMHRLEWSPAQLGIHPFTRPSSSIFRSTSVHNPPPLSLNLTHRLHISAAEFTPASHSPSSSLCSFTSSSTATIDFDFDSDDTPPTTASPFTPAFSRPSHLPSPSVVSSPHTSYQALASASLDTSPSSRSISSSSSFQSLPTDESFFSPFTPSPQPKTCRKWDQSSDSSLIVRQPWVQSLPYKRVPSHSGRRSLSRLRAPSTLPLPSSSEKVRPKCSSMSRYHSSLVQYRQRTHHLFWNVACCLFVFLIFIINLVYFIEYLQSRLIRPTFTSNTNDLGRMVIEAPERDCLVIYRIIGNDLPPRHSPHQTLTNLKFLLEHENDFKNLPSLIPSQTYINGTQFKSDLQVKLKKQSNTAGSLNVRKYYILNRIANETQFEQVSNLLLNSGVASDRILTIPFEMAEYEKRELRSTRLQGDQWGGKGHETGELKIGLEAGEEDVDLISADEKRRWAMGRLRALDSIYHEKNLYAMNNNGGRNFALTHGRAQADARWVLALDGNCILTPAALTDLVHGLVEQEAGAARTGTTPASHVVIPMSRLLDNREVLVNNTANVEGDQDLKPMSVEEPQIGFRFSSDATYSNRMRYGRRSKVELLWRLGAIQRNRERVERTIPEWESDERELITEASYGSIRRDSDQLDFVMAGWVHRLFSGDDRRQEEPTEMAISRRSINRIKGIVWFLEALDQRRLVRQPTIDHPQLFNLNFSQLAELRMSNSHASLALKQRIGTLATSMVVNSSDLHRPIHAFVFALTDYLTQQFQFRSKALDLIRADLLITPPPESHPNRPSRASIDPIGYYFPPRPSTTRSGREQPELSHLPSRLTEPDSTFYLDTISLLFINSSSPSLPQLTSTETERLYNTFNAHTDHLIHLQPNPSLHPIQIDLQLAALASFTQNARLLNRILTRTHLRKACDDRPEHLQSDLTIGLGNLDLKPEWVPCSKDFRFTKENRNLLSSSTSPLANFLSMII